jgi:hypothetical protein
LYSSAIGSAGNRDKWATLKASLIASSETNKNSFHEVDSALFVVCLDDTSPDTLDQFCQVIPALSFSFFLFFFLSFFIFFYLFIIIFLDFDTTSLFRRF